MSTGFPSPAADFKDSGIDLNKLLIKHPASTFFGTVEGDYLHGLGISSDDLLVIDKSQKVENGLIAVCYINNEFMLKRILIEDGTCWLMSANDKYKPIRVTEDNEFVVWGVVVVIIKDCLKCMRW